MKPPSSNWICRHPPAIEADNRISPCKNRDPLTLRFEWAQTPSRTWRTALPDAISRRLWLLNSAKLCAAARRHTGAEDFGAPSVEPALSVLTESLEHEANLHPLGRFLMRVHLRGLLETRLRLAALWRSNSSAPILPPIQSPIFVTGMPRSGSTFLHELLAQDPANRAPRVWEVMFPLPPSRPRKSGLDPRMKKAAACLWWFRRLAPAADAVFPLRAGTPHECVAIHSHTFLSQEFVSTCDIPTYEEFLRESDLSPAYAWEYRFLQHLQSGSPPRRWILKSPDHAHTLRELFAVFPDAFVIQTHRNPLEVLESSCQLTRVLRGLYARAGDYRQIAAHEARVLADSMDRLIEFRDRHPELADRFVDVNYRELVSNPVGIVRHIYQKFGIPLTSVAMKQMQQLASHRSRYGNGRATVPPARGLRGLQGACDFERYCSRFQIARQP